MTADTLFDVPEPERPEPAEKISADRRRTQRQHTAIANGLHPLGLALAGRQLLLHPDALVDDRDAPGPTCGGCRFRRQFEHHNRTYPKCTFGAETVTRPTYDRKGTYQATQYPRLSNGAGTDVRAWWPACPDHEPETATQQEGIE